MHEHRIFHETGPSVTRAALAKVIDAHPFFEGLEYAVDFGDFECHIHGETDTMAASIEFVITVWHERLVEGTHAASPWRAQVDNALDEVERSLQAEYGGMVFGSQPPARPGWHSRGKGQTRL